MNKYIFLLLTLIPISLSSQSISQIQLRYFKKFNDFWTGKKSSLGIEFHKINIKNSTDTVYTVFIKALNQEYETVGVTSGISFSYSSLFSLSSGGASRSEALIRQKGADTLSYNMCVNLSKMFNSVRQYARELDIKKQPLDYIISDTMKDIEFTVKYFPGSLESKFDYLFTVGDITFNMSDTEVIELAKFIRSIIVKWDNSSPKS